MKTFEKVSDGNCCFSFYKIQLISCKLRLITETNSELLPIKNSSTLVPFSSNKNRYEFLLGNNQALYIKSFRLFCFLIVEYVFHSLWENTWIFWGLAIIFTIIWWNWLNSPSFLLVFSSWIEGQTHGSMALSLCFSVYECLLPPLPKKRPGL